MNQLKKLWTKTNCLLFLIYTFLRSLSTGQKKRFSVSDLLPKKWTMYQEQSEIKVAKFSTTAKQRSLTVRIVQAFNYLKQNDLIPVNIHEMSKVSCMSL